MRQLWEELGYCNLKKDIWTSEKTTELIKLRKHIKIDRDNTQDDMSVNRSINKGYNIIIRMVKNWQRNTKMTRQIISPKKSKKLTKRAT